MFDLNSPSRRKTVKVLAVGNYAVLFLDMIQGLGFVPLYLAYFGERMYGLWLGTGGVIGVLSFLDLGIATLCIQRVAREYGKKDFDGIGLYFFNGFLINMVFMIILLLGGLIANLYLDQLFDITLIEQHQLSKAFVIALFALVLSLLNNTVEGCLNSLQKAMLPKFFQLLGSIVGILVTYFVLISGEGIIAIPLGIFCRYLIILIPNLTYLLILFIKNNIPIFVYNRETIRDYFQLSPSVFLSKLGTSLVNNAEPTLINIFISPQIAVFYSITKKAGTLVRLILDRIGGVIYPSLSHLHSSENDVEFKNFILKLLKIIFPVTLMGFLMYVLANELFIELWVGVENYMGMYMTVLIALSLLMGFFSNFLSYLISATGDIKYPSIVLFFESLLKIFFLYTFLKLMGVNGLPLSLLVVSFLFCIVYVFRWQKHLKFKVGERKNIIISLLKTSFVYSTLVGTVLFSIRYFEIQTVPVLLSIYFVVFILLILILTFQNPDLRAFLIKKKNH